jgi:Skp family chaperone for outer membrane proteins
MNRMLGIAVLALLGAGCATNSSVKGRIDPLAERVTAVEQKNSAMESSLADLNRKLDTQAGDLQTSQRNLAEMSAAAQKAQQAAADAQAAATRAETAADKAAKAFELRQRKGAR